MTFLAPGYLFLLLALPAVWFLPHRLRDVRHGLLRTITLAFVIVALARPVSLSEGEEEHHVFILDGSASVVPAERDAARAAIIRGLPNQPESVHSSVVQIGEGLDADQLPDGLESLVHLDTTRATSPLGSALDAAGRLIPEGARGAVTLVSDGRATDRRWGAAVQDLEARGIPVHVAGLSSLPGDVFPVRMNVQGPLRVGVSTRVLVDVIGEDAVVSVTLSGPDGVLAEAVDLRLEKRLRVPLEFEPMEPGFLPLRADVQVTAGSDTRPGDNSLTRTFAVQDPLRVLYLGERMVGGGVKLSKLVGRGFELTSPDEVPEGESALDEYDLVVVDDRPAARVPVSFQRRITRAVRDQGLGLMVSGGGASFGPGGYYESPLETILPVEFVQKEEKKDPSTALAIIIDTSGSMSGNRIRLAKEVTRLAIRRLLPHDKVGIVEFYGAKRWAAPLQSAANAIDIQRALNRLDAGGGTILLPAIEEAYYGLKNVQTRYKHVMMLTDAGVETGPYETMMRRMARDGICVSTVLVGPERHSEFLVQLADWGNGRFYNCSDRFNLPEVMLKQPSTARLPAYRPGSYPVEPRGGPGWWGEIDPTSTPEVAGYVESESRPGAEVLLRTAQESHPVLATWRYGLGRVTTLMTEPTGPGTEPWRNWDGYGPFLARVMSRTSSETRAPFHFWIERSDHRLSVWAERRDRSEVLPLARVLSEDGSDGRELEFRERSDGLFSAELQADPAAAVRVLAGTSGEPGASFRLVSDPREDEAPEHQVDPALGLDLTRVAAATGGEIVTSARLRDFRPPAGGGARPWTVLTLWPLSLLLALLVYLGDIAYRRSPLRKEMETTA